MPGKWEQFHKKWDEFQKTHNNSVDVIGAMNHNGSGTFGADWARCVSPDKDKVFINGKGLSTYAEEYGFYSKNQTASELNRKVKEFFRNVLLKDVCASDEAKQQMVDYLASIFHQGGLMNPVSTGVSVALNKFGAAVDTGLLDSRLEITTTPTGIKVDETCTVSQLLVPDDKTRQKLKLTESPIISPDDNKNFVIQASTAIELNFSSSGKPSFSLEKNQIDYGSELIKKALPERNIFKTIVDFIVRLFKSNPDKIAPLNVEKNSPSDPKPELVEEHGEQTSFKL